VKIKVLIFDLDDTLFDCTGTLVESARRRAIRAMVNAGLPCTEQEAYEKSKSILKKYGEKCALFDKLCQEYAVVDPELVNVAYKEYNNEQVEKISLFADVAPTLKKLTDYKLALVTSGIFKRQMRKVHMLKLHDAFDLILVSDQYLGPPKEDCFKQVLKHFRATPNEVISVGDKLHDEIRMSNRLGFLTVQIKQGRFQDIEPLNDLEVPDFKIEKISELPKIIEGFENGNTPLQPSIVTIGGGTGNFMLLRGLKKKKCKLSTIVNMVDNGGSTGLLRDELGVLPPGDVRQCLVALSESDSKMRDLINYRFANGGLKGHSFGNLLLSALEKVHGNFADAVEHASNILSIRGNVIPVTLEKTDLHAALKSRLVLKGENLVSKHNVMRDIINHVEELELRPKVNANPNALHAIENADLIVVAPGMFNASILSNMLVSGIPAAINKSKAKKVYVCNLMSTKATNFLKVTDFTKSLNKFIDLDYVIVNSQEPENQLLNKYSAKEEVKVEDNSHQLNDVEVITANLLKDTKEKQNKQDKISRSLIRHDPNKTADVLMNILKQEN